MEQRIAIILPVYNGGSLWAECAKEIRNGFDGKVLVIDSSSSDNSVEIATKYGFDIHTIKSSEFNHGRTRNLGISLVENDADIAVFLTQDALLADKESITKLIHYLMSTPDLCAVYGRQLPHDNANPLAKFARLFNYKKYSYTTDLYDSKIVGIKKVFMSNSFSAYNISILKKLGGFPENTILCEDMYLAATAILNGYKVGYCAEALVKHSHNYSPVEEFKRYFDIGVFHSTEKWISTEFGSAKGEGKLFIISEFKYLLSNHPVWILASLINNASKFLGYKFGKVYQSLPISIIRKLSMHKKYWDQQ